ncbi:dihydroorotase [Candidatus Poriferisocius sp.]|uniref:dihydroorotase n=1 Tax=Candidatus Poriferisocius sp. TaxID=3101276 RepID=UPI003B018A33
MTETVPQHGTETVPQPAIEASTPPDFVVAGAVVVRPDAGIAEKLDIAITGGKVSQLAAGLAASAPAGTEVFDASGLVAFPGSVDAHTHMGIYNPLDEDAVSESRAAAQGGTTTVLNYMRTGQYYLNQGGPYAEFFPEVLRRMDGHCHVDYGFHLAPMEAAHIDEIPMLVTEHGVTSFKIFMFYGGHGLHGASDDQARFLMTPAGERYDYAHFEFVMRGIAEVRRAHPELAATLSLSLHCESAEIMTAYTRMVEAEGRLSGLAAYSASRPPHSEGLAVTIASYLAHETDVVNINLLHLSSAKAMDAALRMSRCFENVNFRREVTIGHLLVDIETSGDPWGKVNPPIRPRHDVEALWEHVLAGDVDWVVSDHACCRAEAKVSASRPDDIWLAKSGFGGTEYLLNGLYSEGTKRGLGLVDIARLLSWNPARRYGLGTKGTIGVGYDADIALLDPAISHVVRAGESESSQGYSPFEGQELTGRVSHVWLRGRRILDGGKVVGDPLGQYQKRPT